MTVTPEVDVIVPVHVATRPLGRAVASVLEGTHASVRVTVVCHNIRPTDVVPSLGNWVTSPSVRVLEHHDGFPSPAGPINAGLDAATAEFSALLGSDDEYEPGAVDAWLGVARRDGADVVIPRMRVEGSAVPTPLTRPFRRRHLEGVKDRLSYRTVQLGLVSRHAFGDVRMTHGLLTGEDVAQGIALWFSDARISYARSLPGYLVHADGCDTRASTSRKPAAESLRFLDTVLGPGVQRKLNATQRESLAVKLLRTHVMDVLGASLRSEKLADDAAALRLAVEAVLTTAPRAANIMSRTEVAVLREICGEARPAVLAGLHRRVTDFTHPSSILPASGRYLLHREAMPRLLASHAVMLLSA